MKQLLRFGESGTSDASLTRRESLELVGRDADLLTKDRSCNENVNGRFSFPSSETRLTLSTLDEIGTARVHRLVDRGSTRLSTGEGNSIGIELGQLLDSVGVVLTNECAHTELDEI